VTFSLSLSEQLCILDFADVFKAQLDQCSRARFKYTVGCVFLSLYVHA